MPDTQILRSAQNDNSLFPLGSAQNDNSLFPSDCARNDKNDWNDKNPERQ